MLASVGRDVEFSKLLGDGDELHISIILIEVSAECDSKWTVFRELAYPRAYVDMDFTFILNLKEESMI